MKKWPIILCAIAMLVVVCAVQCPALAAGAATQVSGDAHEHISPSLKEMDNWGEHARTAKTMLVLFQIAVMLGAAKLLGWAAERVHVPGVIGELLAGVIIGPYVLGHMIQIPLGTHSAPLFPMPLSGEWPVNDMVWTLAQFASIILLFITGLHTDLRQFLKYVGPASLVAIVGLIAPFALGFATVYYVPAFRDMATGVPGESPLVPALFIGAILAATSIGITARVLGDIGKLDTPEGVTILGAAVLDDVLGIIALAIVGGIAADGAISAGSVSVIASKAFGFWIGLTVVVFVLAKPIEKLLTGVKYGGAMVGFAIAIAFICSAAAEGFGLAFIIGAYSVGLGLSQTRMAHTLMGKLEAIGDFVVPIFFAALGMLVNVKAMFASPGVIIFGLTITLMSVIGKLVGCGAAAMPMGFNARGAYRIGLGMLPRGEVALIVAGIGLSRHLVGEVVFGVSIMMTLITTILAPVLLVPAFNRGGSGRKHPRDEEAPPPPLDVNFTIHAAPAISRMMVDRIISIAETSGWTAAYDSFVDNTYLLRCGKDAAAVVIRNDKASVDVNDRRQAEFRAFIQRARDELTEQARSVDVEMKTDERPKKLPPK